MKRKPKQRQESVALPVLVIAMTVLAFGLNMYVLKQRAQIGTLQLQIQVQRETLDRIGYKAAGFPGERP